MPYSARSFHHFENSIGFDRIVRKYRNAMFVRINSSRQFGWINHVERNIRRIVQINAFVKHHGIARSSRASGVCRIEIAAVVAHVIKQAVRDGRTAGHKRQEPRERI